MQTKIEFNPGHAMLTIQLQAGEIIKAEPGTMIAQSGIELSIRAASNHVLDSLGRQSLFVNTFRAGPSNGWVSLAPTSPGDIAKQELQTEQCLFIQPQAFLAATENIATQSKFQGIRKFFSRQGMYLLRAQAQNGPGTIWFNACGAIKEIHVSDADELIVDTGHLVAFTEGLNYTVGKVSSVTSLFASREGLVLKIKGTGRAWIQTQKYGTK